MGTSVDGLVSGLDTTSIITQLMQAEAIPQNLLKTKLTTTQTAATAYRTVNSSVDALRTAAEALTKPGAWAAAKVTSSAASVTATVDPSATAATLGFDVVATAAAHTVVSASTWGATSDAFGGTVPVTVYNADGTVRGQVTPGGNGTLADVVNALNKSDLGVSAAAVQTAPGQYRLQVTATDSGAAQQFSLGQAGEFAVVTAGADAHLRVGTGPGAYDVYSTTNTFDALLPGVSFTVTKPETGVSLQVSGDPSGLADKVQSLVDAVNTALTTIKKYGAASSTPGASGVLAGDYALSQLTSDLTQAVTSAVGALGSAATAGLQVDRDGAITFDKTTFLAAYAKDPAKISALVVGRAADSGVDGVTGTADDVAAVTGVAGRLASVAARASDKTSGTLTLLAQGRDATADDLQKRIEDWDLRLAMRKETLQRQFTALETALSTNQSQSQWLAGQISSLPTMS